MVDVQGATAPWGKPTKVLKKANTFFSFQFNNFIIWGGEKDLSKFNLKVQGSI